MPVKPAIVSAVLALLAAPLGAQTPLSAIDWLNNPAAFPIQKDPVLPPEAAVSSGITSETITVSTLDSISTDAVGLLPRSVSGLPANLWGPTSTAELETLLDSINDADLLPATRDLLFTMLLSELDPPIDSSASGEFFLTRVDTLSRLGAVESAKALLDRAGTDTPDRFARWFDLSLLLGTEADACKRLKASPGLTTSLPARVFCLARNGDWNAAALSLGTARALGQITDTEEALLLRYLDEEFAEDAPPLAIPTAPTPLTFQLFDAIGEPLSTNSLPVAFAHADLRENSGWKSQLEAAERLARKGVLPSNKLLGLYTERRAAASGGVWNRVASVQAFDLSLASVSEAAISKALPVAWSEMQSVGLEPVFAELYSQRLSDIELTGATEALAFRMALLTDSYETAAQSFQTTLAEELFMKSVAQGNLKGVVASNDQMAAIKDGFLATQVSTRFQRMLDDGAIGKALLESIRFIGHGADGDVAKLTEAIALLRNLGLEDVARRAALQVMILDTRG